MVLSLLLVLVTTAAWRVLDDDVVGSDAAAPSAPSAPGGAGSGGAAPSAPDDPDVWPVELEPLVEFVERERGGPFTGPVPVEYLDEDAYAEAVAGETSDTTPEDAADTEIWEGQLAALGLIEPGTSVEDALDDLYSGGTLAYYDDEEDVVRVRGTRFDVAMQVTLVHELTHVWQDQHGFLDGFREMDDTPAYVLQTLAEGDASRIESAFVDELSPRDLDDYIDQSADQAGRADLSGVPDALLAAFSSPYVLGEQFVAVLAQLGGNEEVDAAFTELPESEADLMVPTRHLDRVRPVEVAPPPLPDGAERLGEAEPFGATSWIITLSEVIDPRQALDLVDRWAGDSSVVYRLDGRVCTAVAYRGQTPEGTRLGLERIDAWAQGSAGLDARAEDLGEVAVLRACEPTDGGDVAGRGQVAMRYPAIRLEATVQALADGADLDQATCFGDALADLLEYGEVETGALYLPDRARPLVEEAQAAC